MKALMIAVLIMSGSVFAAERLGENANPEYRECLGVDKCPSQMCKNSCAMMNHTQTCDDRNNNCGRTRTTAGARGKKGSSTSKQ